MKFTLPLLITLFSTSAFADVDLREFMPGFASKNKSLSCRSGDGQAHTNPDNSPSGFVAKTAKVEAGALIAANAQVCDQAQVKSGARILGQAVIGGRAQINSNAEVSGFAQVMGEARISSGVKISGNAVIEGSPQISGATLISGLAKIEGGSKIHNSIICQASQITNFDVIDSDYYCQTEDPEPPHPGEAGKKTLLGIDVDRDGVRDDIEIWINQKFSNTPTKDNYNLRKVFKLQAIQNNESLKWASDKNKSREISKKKIDLQECMLSFSRSNSKLLRKRLKALDVIDDISDDFKMNIMNTRERMRAHSKYLSNLHGTVLEGTGKKDVCGFEVRK